MPAGCRCSWPADAEATAEQTAEEASPQLDFEWSLSGQPDAEDAVDFQFELPACPANRVILDLPERMTPVVDQGLVYPAGWVDESVRRWQIELGGHHRFGLRVLRGIAGQTPQQLPLVRESVTYQFQPHGLDVVDEMEFEALDGPVRQIAVVLDPGLVLASAEWGDALVPWSQGPVSDGGQTPIAMTLPEPANEARRVLRLRALAPLVSDHPWQLPRISVEGVLWQEGTATLLVPSQLVVQRLLPIGCRQTGTGPLAGDWGGELFQFQYLTADATVEVAVSRRRWPVQMTSGTAVELSDRGATARMVADFRVTEEPRFVLDADVAPGWVIDSIESFPAEAMEDWAPGRSRGRRRSLTIRLAESLAPSRPLRLVINARRFRSPLGGTLGVVDLVPLQFLVFENSVSEDGVSEDSRRLVAVRAVGTYQLRLSGTERLQRIDPRDLGAAERSLFAQTPAELLFENDAGAGELRISLANRPAGYAAQIGVEAVVGKTSLREDYSLRCTAESPRVDRVVVYFSSRRASPVRWTFADEGEQQITARPFSDDELEAAGLTAEQEAWELTLRRPMSTAFEIHGTRESKLLGRAADQPGFDAGGKRPAGDSGRSLVGSDGGPDPQPATHADPGRGGGARTVRDRSRGLPLRSGGRRRAALGGGGDRLARGGGRHALGLGLGLPARIALRGQRRRPASGNLPRTELRRQGDPGGPAGGRDHEGRLRDLGRSAARDAGPARQRFGQPAVDRPSSRRAVSGGVDSVRDGRLPIGDDRLAGRAASGGRSEGPRAAVDRVAAARV